MLVTIILISLVLLIAALLYFYRSRLLSPRNNKIGSPGSIRYDSKISLCSLIFDQTDSLLYISYGNKHSQISFADITAFKVAINFDCVMTISKDEAQVFDEQAEENLVGLLEKLEAEILAADENRQLSLEIFSEQKAGVKPILVNFYYREGDLRLSPHSFSRAVEDLLLWCDLLETAIRPVVDEQAEIVPEIEEKPSSVFNIFSEPDVESEQPITPDETTQTTQAIQTAPAAPTSHDLADELARLSDLKAQGFLSDEEFTRAKDKIIN